MTMTQGVFEAYKKDGTKYYRSSITFRNKHISLGSYDSENKAGKAYEEAKKVLEGSCGISDYSENQVLKFNKLVSLINFRDNGMYIKTPVYLQKRYFEYYYSPDVIYKFDVDDLFYYSHHTIMMRGGYLFVTDYGMQTNILSRYGIKNHAVEGRDFIFVNGDNTDYRYGNIEIINRFYGVLKCEKNGKIYFRTRIHINGDFIVGDYETEYEAAVAYNKAADMVKDFGINIDFPQNYIEEFSAIDYAKIYNKVKISKKIRDFVQGY